MSDSQGERSGQAGEGPAKPRGSVDVSWLRETRRGKMVKTLEHLLKVARREARRAGTPPSQRLKWVNTICYITQTLNSVLKDTDYDQLKQQILTMQEKIGDLTVGKHKQPEETDRRDQQQTGQPL